MELGVPVDTVFTRRFVPSFRTTALCFAGVGIIMAVWHLSFPVTSLQAQDSVLSLAGWDESGNMICQKYVDYFKTCGDYKLCGKGGCYDCPSGHHICNRGKNYYKTSCPPGKRCDSTGCVPDSSGDPDNPELCHSSVPTAAPTSAAPTTAPTSPTPAPTSPTSAPTPAPTSAPTNFAPAPPAPAPTPPPATPIEASAAHVKYEDYIIGPSGVQPADIVQGALGDCYFDGSMASIAAKHPDVIEAMFTNRDLWSQGIVTTKWHYDGHAEEVAVNQFIPTCKKKASGICTTSLIGKPAFLRISSSNMVWPIILEKAWAKIIGNYKWVESGSGAEAIMALTGAPTSYYTLAQETDKFLLAKFRSAKAHNKVMTTGTSAGNAALGIAGGHLYSIMDFSDDHNGEIAVQLRNPWGTNGYKGKLYSGDKSDHSTGYFWCTWSEYRASFVSMTVGHISTGFKPQAATPMRITNGQGSGVAFTVTLTKAQPFTAQLVFPGTRLTKICGDSLRHDRGNSYGVFVARADNPTNVTTSTSVEVSASVHVNMWSATVGTYIVYVSGVFEADWLKTVYANIYGASIGMEVAASTEAETIGKMLGIPTDCDKFNVKYPVSKKGFEKYFFDQDCEPDDRVNGFPAWKCGSRHKVLFLARGRGYCFGTPPERCYSLEDYKPAKMEKLCAGVASLSLAVVEPDDARAILLPAIELGNEPAEIPLIAAAQPVALAVDGAKCAANVERLDTLNNTKDMIARGSDALFPETYSSIADKSDTCGDTAKGSSGPCDVFNAWRDWGIILQEKLHDAQCLAFTWDKFNCDFINTCSEPADLSCSKETCKVKKSNAKVGFSLSTLIMQPWDKQKTCCEAPDTDMDSQALGNTWQGPCGTVTQVAR